MDRYTQPDLLLPKEEDMPPHLDPAKERDPEGDQDFIPINLKPNGEQIKERKKRKPRQCYKLWESEENKTFLQFLTLHQSEFQDLQSRRSNKVFVNMAQNFEFRNSHQCKSHYQKLQKMTKSKNVGDMIKLLEKKLKKQKVLFQRIIKKHKLLYPKSADSEDGIVNIYYSKDKFFEIYIHLDGRRIQSW